MFGQAAGSGDLLLGRSSGFDGSVTQNGFGNNDNGTSSNSSNNPSGSSAFDLNDFPSLGGGGNGNPSGNGGDNNSLAAALRQQQQVLAQQQLLKPSVNGVGGGSGSNNSQNSSNLYRLAMGTSMGTSLSSSAGGARFSMGTEDFPALPGAPPASSNGGTATQGILESNSNTEASSQARELSGSTTSGSNFTSTGASRSGTGGVFGSNGSGDMDNMDSGSLMGVGGLGGNPGSNVAGGANPNNLSMQQRLSTSSTSNQISSSSSNPAGNTAPSGASLSGDYGLLGLLGIIRMSDADRNALALGSDLTTLGLNLNSNDQLYSNFASPWSESLTTREPQYQLPMCYYMQPPALKTGHLSKFALETLFYIFYALPKDVLQAYAAQELYSRDWKYHVELKLWFKRAGPSDGVSTSGNGTQYIYFDINSWERRLFNGNMNQNITSGLLPEDDIRVKFPSS